MPIKEFQLPWEIRRRINELSLITPDMASRYDQYYPDIKESRIQEGWNQLAKRKVFMLQLAFDYYALKEFSGLPMKWPEEREKDE